MQSRFRQKGSAPVRKIATVVIGAGHAGLAMSHILTERSIEHVVLERGEIANSWRTERWDSLRLLTPNWQSRLPGFSYDGNDPDGFRTMPEVIAFFDRYAQIISAPVQTHTRVTSVRRNEPDYIVETDQGDWSCRTLVIATGACNVPVVPPCASAVPGKICMPSPIEYRDPGQIEPGGVLVVGASATGIQLAQEIHLSGRPVTLAVGEHIRAPRIYRGKDIQWWMDASGLFDQRYDEVDDLVRVRRLPSMQLVGTPERMTLDLNALTAIGVRLVGRVAGIRDGRIQFSGSLLNQCALADLKMARLLDTIDQWAGEQGWNERVQPPFRFPETRIEESPPLELDLASGEIRTILWATGYQPDYSWLHLPILDRKGHIRHDGGVTELPGLYVMGLPFLRKRKSVFIDGAGDDARDLGGHLTAFLARQAPAFLTPAPAPANSI